MYWNFAKHATQNVVDKVHITQLTNRYCDKRNKWHNHLIHCQDRARLTEICPSKIRRLKKEEGKKNYFASQLGIIKSIQNPYPYTNAPLCFTAPLESSISLITLSHGWSSY